LSRAGFLGVFLTATKKCVIIKKNKPNIMKILPQHLRPKAKTSNQNYFLIGVFVFVFAISGGFVTGFSKNNQALANNYNSKNYILPVSGMVTQTWNGEFSHTNMMAIDISAPENTPVIASKEGKVVRSANDGLYNSGYGNFVVIEQKEGGFAYYGHLSKTVAKQGDFVKQGTIIGNVGSTGQTTGSHLHFEVKKNLRGFETLPFYFVGCDNCVLEDGKSYNSNLAIIPIQMVQKVDCPSLFTQKYKIGQVGENIKQLQTCLKEKQLFNYPTITGKVGSITIEGLTKVKVGQDLCDLLYQKNWKIGQNATQLSSCLKSVRLVKNLSSKVNNSLLKSIKKLNPQLIANSNI
jgi:hypothetical protein